MEKSSLFITLNFREMNKEYIQKDNLENLPYLYALVNNPRHGDSARDDDGNLIVDEHIENIFKIIDYYRLWLEEGKPNYISCVRKGLIASIAKRNGCEKEFTNAILSDKKYYESNFFNCYYCGELYTTDERLNCCRYHSVDCECKYKGNGCARVPHHTPDPFEKAKPKLFKK